MEYIQAHTDEPRRRVRLLCGSPGIRPGADPGATSSLRDLEKFPYNPGHLLVVPARHVGDLEELSAEENAGMQCCSRRSVRALREVSSRTGSTWG